MKIQKIIISVVSVSAFLLVASSATPALALDVTASTSVQTTTTDTVKVDVKVTTQIAKIVERSDAAIAKRIEDLNKLNVRLQAMKNVSAEIKTNVASIIQTNVNGLMALKTKIDADTDVKVALADEKEITQTFRIYALMIPQGYIVASADRVAIVSDLLLALGAKLQARITVAQTEGKDVTALQALFSDFNAKIADSRVQAEAAMTSVASLQADGGDKAKLAANTAVLKAARAKMKTATMDLRTAEQDAKKISQGLKTLSVKGGANVNGTTTVQH